MDNYCIKASLGMLQMNVHVSNAELYKQEMFLSFVVS